jgi:membrane protease YdiL (CAAX protease family)
VDLSAWLLKISEWSGVIAVIWLAGLSPRFRPKPLGFKYPRREGIVAISLFTLILAGAFLFYNKMPTAENVTDGLWQRLVVAGAALGITAVALFGRGQPLRSVLWGRELLGAGFRLGLALVMLTLFLEGKIMTLINGVSAQEGSALLAWVGIAFAEETVFRGYIQPRISAWIESLVKTETSNWIVGRLGWLATAGMFVLWQVPRLLPVGLPWQGLVLALVQGLIVGWLAQRSGNLVAPWLYRMISEWLAFVV